MRMKGTVTKKQIALLRYLEMKEKQNRFPFITEIANDPDYLNSNTDSARECLYNTIRLLEEAKLIKRMKLRSEMVKWGKGKKIVKVRPIRLTNNGRLYLKAADNINMVRSFVDMLEETEDGGESILKELELD